MVQAIRGTFTSIENLPIPVICAINGYALGGGLELALACDIRVASENAKMGLTETSLGIVPGGGGTQRLPRLIGRGKAKELILTADMVTAEVAYEIGIVNRVVPAGKALEESFKIARKIAGNAPVAVRQAKFAINRGMEVDINAGLSMEASAYEICIGTEDRLEALKAFKEKRKPVFRGE
jgi:enoyl-CoA hydratase/carnithine racemase